VTPEVDPEPEGGAISVGEATAVNQYDADIADAVQEPHTPSVSERFQLLFDELKIKKIVVVDDHLEKQLDGAFVTEILQSSPKAAEAAEPFFPEIDLSSENENLFNLVTAKLAALNANQRAELSAVLSEFEQTAADVNVLQHVQDLVPAGFNLEFLTPTKWSEKREGLLQECTLEARTLFLFDQELDPEGAGEIKKGTEIIAELAAQDEAAFGTRWFCGLLSHTVNKGDEVSKWRELCSEEENLELELFMPISKQSLSDGEDFYGAVYRTVINIYTEKMKGLAKRAFDGALQGALEEFTNIDPVAFEHMIVKSSEVEGVSELETILRLYSIVQRDRVKSELLREENLSRFLDAARTVKKIADVGRALPDAAAKSLRRLRSAELYEEGNLINKFRDPLRNGDLFETGASGSPKHWVLIAQPCDLMVRPDGKRAYSNNFKVAVLAPIRRGAPGEAPEVKSNSFALERFDHGGTQHACVNFAEATPVDLNVLDLAVLRTDGKCEISPLEPANHGKFASLAWDTRAVRLSDKYKKVAKKIEKERDDHGDVRAKEVAGYVVPPTAPADSFRNYGKYDQGKFVYKVRRYGRLREPFATSLLAAFGRYLSRDAHEHDFSKD
jgi:hypothetical protein